MPVVSVIVPVYNAEPFLAESLDCILSQTLGDIEVICVDDGSTDGSAQTLESLATSDSRLRVVRQANQGAGAARNAALKQARGTYVVFLDADDMYARRMLETAVGSAEQFAAEIVLYGGQAYEQDTGQTVKMEWLVRKDMLPQARPFSATDLGDNLFLFTTPAPWNKLYRREFIQGANLQFQETRRANDLRFTMLALAHATAITVIDEVLVTYRVGTGVSLQSTNHQTPTEFYKALLSLREHLAESGKLASFERSFVNAALGHCLYTLRSIQQAAAFLDLYEQLRSEAFESLGIAGHDPEYYLVRRDYDEYVKIAEHDASQYLLSKLKDVQSQVQSTRAQLRSSTAELRKVRAKTAAIRKWRAYRLGGALVRVADGIRSPFRLLKRGTTVKG